MQIENYSRNPLIFDAFERGIVELTYADHQIHPILKQANDKFCKGYYFNNAKLDGTNIICGNQTIVFLIYDKVQADISEALQPNYKGFEVRDAFSIKETNEFVIIAGL
jgi:hypothetical protein